MKMDRRKFLKVGIAGGVVLASVGYASHGVFWGGDSQKATVDGHAYDFFTVRDHQLMHALVPVLMEDGLTPELQADKAAIYEEIVQSVDFVIAGFLPEVQAELRQLFSLLTFAPSRIAIGGPFGGWHNAKPEKVRSFLEGWRYSSVALFQSAYDALVQLTMGSWYGNQKSWSFIGYPGPPNLGTT